MNSPFGNITRLIPFSLNGHDYMASVPVDQIGATRVRFLGGLHYVPVTYQMLAIISARLIRDNDKGRKVGDTPSVFSRLFKQYVLLNALCVAFSTQHTQTLDNVA